MCDLLKVARSFDQHLIHNVVFQDRPNFFAGRTWWGTWGYLAGVSGIPIRRFLLYIGFGKRRVWYEMVERAQWGIKCRGVAQFIVVGIIPGS